MDTRKRTSLKAKGQSLPATVHIGKAGPNDAIVSELKRQLDLRGLVKVRLLASSRGADAGAALAKDLADGTGAEVVEVRGFTALLWKPRRRQRGGP